MGSLMVHVALAVVCKVCPDGVGDLSSCTKLGKCDNGAVCYKEKYIDNSGLIVWFAGCRSLQQCRDTGLITRRGVSANATALARAKRQAGLLGPLEAECCDKDYCNSAPPPSAGYTECFGCDGVANP